MLLVTCYYVTSDSGSILLNLLYTNNNTFSIPVVYFMLDLFDTSWKACKNILSYVFFK